MAPGEDTDSGMESQEGSLRESQGSINNGKEGQDSTNGTSNQESGGSAVEVAPSSEQVEVEEFTPETKPEIEDPYSDEADETIAERLWGLTEMFPESVRNTSYTVAMSTTSSIKSFYGFSRSAFWVLFSSSIILFAPVIFEVERVQMEEAQRSQQKQMLLGPSTAVSGGGGPLMPPMHR